LLAPKACQCKSLCSLSAKSGSSLKKRPDKSWERSLRDYRDEENKKGLVIKGKKAKFYRTWE
jgi:hypothetical protein